MNKIEKDIAKAQLSSEEKTLKELQQVFKKARKDVQDRITELNARQDMQNLQSIVYQKKYQQAILGQINEALADLSSGQYKTVEEYLVDSYDNGYIGMMYSLQSQGIPMTVPINDRNVVKALTTDSQLSKKYYKADPLKGKLEENVSLLKTRVRSNLSRGIIAGKSWLDVAVDIASGMNNPFDIALKDAMRIARTEGHRVHQQGYLDAGDKAKEKGADILKQWDATMDSKTRPAHQQADGQIVEWDEYFTVGGEKMKAPSVGGSAKNVVNCRCQLLQRARWALDESELETLQKRAEFFGLDKAESFEDFKQKYLKLPEKADTIKVPSEAEIKDRIDQLHLQTVKLKGAMDDQEYQEYIRIVATNPDISKFYNHADALREVKYLNGGGCFYDSGRLEFGYPAKHYLDDGMSKYHTVAHEYGHFFDTFARMSDRFDTSSLTWNEMQAIKDGVGAKYTTHLTSHVLSNSDQFLTAVRKDFEKIIADGNIKSYCTAEGMRNVTTGIQDAVDGWGLGRIAWGHGDKYYNRVYNRLKSWTQYGSVDPTKKLKDVYTDLGFDASNQAKVKKIVRQYESTSELWANMISAETTGGKELETIKEKFPEAYKTMKEILKGVK